MTAETKYISTTALSKELNLPVSDLFSLLLEQGLVERKENIWVLTEKGKMQGGVVKFSPNIGPWIAWPENIKESDIFKKKNDNDNIKLLTATAISKHFGIARFRVNPILSELGFVQKERKGWVLTKLGTSVGGRQFEHEKTGIPYVCWPKSFLQNKRLYETMKEILGDTLEKSSYQDVEVDFREKYEAKHRTADGHYVRSKAEMLIDNWLYMSEIVHAYERKLPIEEDVYCDFYLPNGKVYIEYWGYEDDEKYLSRKNAKLQIYEKYGFNLIELNEGDIQNLDDILPKKLLKFGIQAY